MLKRQTRRFPCHTGFGARKGKGLLFRLQEVFLISSSNDKNSLPCLAHFAVLMWFDACTCQSHERPLKDKPRPPRHNPCFSWLIRWVVTTGTFVLLPTKALRLLRLSCSVSVSSPLWSFHPLPSAGVRVGSQGADTSRFTLHAKDLSSSVGQRNQRLRFLLNNSYLSNSSQSDGNLLVATEPPM